ncbi:hypothetical protein NBRC116601_02700 [Cognatishimia sp. WU-CL00825]|uniref:AbiTii domain-containing protein n=1 Tax=Cognatishimia sp. WU-CL00825 TaxID=3127658 RepID=UPI0031028C17
MFRSQSKSSSLVLEIQTAAMAENVDIESLLRKAKVAAVKLLQPKAISWIDHELDGYDCVFNELPRYRRLHGELKAWNPYNGFIPIIIQDSRTEELVTRTPVNGGVGTLQKLLARNSANGDLQYRMSGKHKKIIMEMMDIDLEPILKLPTSSIQNALSQVTSLVLNWALELESNGILGEGMTFNKEEQQKASDVTQTIIAQNIGTIGDNLGNAKNTVTIESSGNQVIDQERLADFLSQSKEATSLLPSTIKRAAFDELIAIESAKTEGEKRSHLNSLKTIAEGASGNLAAQGIIQMIASLV